ncbi:MAG: hypothetical protein ACRCYR_20115 [Phycicoccus sp.]
MRVRLIVSMVVCALAAACTQGSRAPGGAGSATPSGGPVLGLGEYAQVTANTREIEATVVAIEAGTAADLAAAGIEPDEPGQVPFSVRVSYRNPAGEDVVEEDETVPQAIVNEFEVYQDDGTPATGLLVLGAFPRCEIGAPSGFNDPGAEFDSCLPVLVDAGRRVTEVRWQFGNGVVDATWR